MNANFINTGAVVRSSVKATGEMNVTSCKENNGGQ